MGVVDWLQQGLARIVEDPHFLEEVLKNGGAVAAIGFVASLSVLATSWLWRHVAAWLSRRITRYGIDVGPWPLDVGSVDNVKLRCLLIRYGTDPYVERMASERDKYEGRLRNRVLHNRISIEPRRRSALLRWAIHWWRCRLLAYTPVKSGSTNIQGNFLLPVHQRLGTQFKLFFQIRAGEAGEAPETTGTGGERAPSTRTAGPPRLVNRRPRPPDADAARRIAERLALQYGLSPEAITEVPEYRRWFRFPPPAYRCHLWFCLDGFPKVATVDGFENNMCFPL